VIFKGQDLNTKWFPEAVPASWRFGASENGWTSQKHAMEWLEKIFDKETQSKAGTLLKQMRFNIR
jgi:hypothetical protein